MDHSGYLHGLGDTRGYCFRPFFTNTASVNHHCPLSTNHSDTVYQPWPAILNNHDSTSHSLQWFSESFTTLISRHSPVSSHNDSSTIVSNKHYQHSSTFINYSQQSSTMSHHSHQRHATTICNDSAWLTGVLSSLESLGLLASMPLGGAGAWHRDESHAGWALVYHQQGRIWQGRISTTKR